MIRSKNKCLFFLQGESNKSSKGSGTKYVPHDGEELPHGSGEQSIHSCMYAIK